MSRASAPASSANLGPGYDVLALALDLRCRVQAAEAGSWTIHSGGAPADPGGESLVRRAAEAAVAGCGPLEVLVESDIPPARGLGSSAALIVATMGAVRALAGEPVDASDLLDGAAAVEGHPDNVAAALFGGLVAVNPSGEVRSPEVHSSLQVLVAVPDAVLPTEEARKATSGPVDTAVASRTAARLASLLEGLRTADPGALAAAAGDELHEARRAHLSPVTGRLVAAARQSGALHACWSGAGPSVLAIVTAETAADVTAALGAVLDRGDVLAPAIDQEGLLVG